MHKILGKDLDMLNVIGDAKFVRFLGYAYGINFKNFTSNNQGSIVI
jgi:hypothetical protein